MSKKLQKDFIAILTSLIFSSMNLNIFVGIISGLWLAILGEWAEVIKGIFLAVVSFFLIPFALMPGFLLAVPAAIAKEHGKKILGIFLAFFNVFYLYALITVWCIWIMWLFISSATESSIIPILIWSYGVALAPWVLHARGDHQLSGNTIFSTFFAQVSYIIAMIIFFLGVPLGTIAITFGVIMLVVAILRTAIESGIEIRKSFYKKEVKEALRILEEENNRSGAGYVLVKSYVEKSILSDKQQFIDVVRQRQPVRNYVYSTIANISRDMIESGQFHKERGGLNPMGLGEELLKIFDSAINKLVILGNIDKESAQEQKELIRKNILDVG